MGRGRFSRPLRGVEVLAMLCAVLDTMRRVESICMGLLGTGVLRLIVPGVGVRVIIHRRCVVDEVEVTR
jgi:hypothetical protein